MLQFAGIEYENHLIGGPAWMEVKSDMPFDKLPVVTFDDGSQLSQSAAISRWVAHHAGLLPSDPLEAARQDMIFEGTQELVGGEFNINALINRAPLDSEEFATLKAQYLENWPNAVGNLAAQLEGDFFGGASPLYADLCAPAISLP